MFILLIRTILLYILVMLSLRMMGKEQISQLQPFEFVAALMISEAATIPMENPAAPLIFAVIPIVTLTVLQISISILTLKSQRFGTFISGKPITVIQHGKVLRRNLLASRYSMNDLLEQMRLKDQPDLDRIAYGILETNGELTILPKPSQYPTLLILDGRLLSCNLSFTKYTKESLLGEVQKRGCSDLSEIFFALTTTEGKLMIQKKGE